MISCMHSSFKINYRPIKINIHILTVLYMHVAQFECCSRDTSIQAGAVIIFHVPTRFSVSLFSLLKRNGLSFRSLNTVINGSDSKNKWCVEKFSNAGCLNCPHLITNCLQFACIKKVIVILPATDPIFLILSVTEIPLMYARFTPIISPYIELDADCQNDWRETN